MTEDYLRNKLEEMVQLLASNHDYMEKQTLILERIANALEDKAENVTSERKRAVANLQDVLPN